MQKTNITKIREIAFPFAYLPIERNKKTPILVSHPFLDTATAIPFKDGQEMINVLDGDGEERFRASIVDRLKRINKLTGFLLLLNKSYRFSFLGHIQSYLSNDDLGMCLRYIWEDSEYTNSGSVFTKKQLISLFNRSSKNTLMDEDELPAFQELPERIIVGTTSINCGDLRVFSWTLSRKKAEWYSQRFNDDIQNIFQTELPKDGVLAYFSTDEEIIADPYKLDSVYTRGRDCDRMEAS